MDRRAFLKQFWNTVFRPVLLLIVVYYCVRLLISLLDEDGIGRPLTLIALGLVILFFLLQLAGTFLREKKEKIYASLSEKARFRWRVTGKVLEFVSILILGMLLFKFWKRDAPAAAFCILLLLVNRIWQIIKEEKDKAITHL